jgi:NAD dependent epimerase/dehydratase family enzyme
MSWIHIDDYVRIVHRLLEDDQEQGAFNLTAPSPVRNLAFTRALVELRHGWALLPAPAFALNLLLGERAELVLGGQCVLPKRIEAAGYSFSYPDLPGALRALLLR